MDALDAYLRKTAGDAKRCGRCRALRDQYNATASSFGEVAPAEYDSERELSLRCAAHRPDTVKTR